MVSDGLSVPVDVSDTPSPDLDLSSPDSVDEVESSASVDDDLSDSTEGETSEKEAVKKEATKKDVSGNSASSDSVPDTVIIREEIDLSGVMDSLDSLMGSVSCGNAETLAAFEKIEYGIEGVNERLSFGISVAMLVLVVWLARLIYRHFDIFFQ